MDHVIYRDYIVNRRFFIDCSVACGSPFAVIRSFVQVIATVTVPEDDKASDLPWLTSLGGPKDGRREFVHWAKSVH